MVKFRGVFELVSFVYLLTLQLQVNQVLVREYLVVFALSLHKQFSTVLSILTHHSKEYHHSTRLNE